MFHHLIDLLKRSPFAGDGKDPAMPDQSPQGGAAAPAAAAAVAPADSPSPLDRQLTTLADAVRELSRSHQTLLDVVSRAAQAAPAAAPSSPRADADVAGDPGDGVRPSAVVDYSKLTPLQQITVGLRDAQPREPAAPRAAQNGNAGTTTTTSARVGAD